MFAGLKPFYFYTTLDGVPVEQAESSNIRHDYDQSSFNMSEIDSVVFQVPRVCKDPDLPRCDFI